MESPLINKQPSSPWETSFPFSSTIFALYPGTNKPLLPGLISLSRFEINICRASVEPIPSNISVPVFSFHLFKIFAGKASPAEIEIRSEEKSHLIVSKLCNWAAKRVGTPKKEMV